MLAAVAALVAVAARASPEAAATSVAGGGGTSGPGGGGSVDPSAAASGGCWPRLRPTKTATSVPPTNITAPTTSSTMATGSSQSILMPTRAVASMPGLPSAFITTTVQSPPRTSQVSAPGCAVATWATQNVWSPGGAGIAVPS